MQTQTGTLASTCGLLGLYAALHRFWPERKRRAWLITTLAAGTSVCLSLSLPFLRLDPRHTVQFFQGYLIADLLAGAAHYAEQMGVLTGWVHHGVYIALLQYVLHRRPAWCAIFAFALVMELPTFLLGAARLFPALRHDGLFTGTFFATRIVLHLGLVGFYATHGEEWGPCVCFCAAFPMHAMWFANQLSARRRRLSSAPIPIPAAPILEEDRAPPELASGPSTALPTPTDEQDLPAFLPAPKEEITDLHLLRHALSDADEQQPLRIRALLAAASRGRYAALAARARGIYREAWERSGRTGAVGRGTGLRREILVP